MEYSAMRPNHFCDWKKGKTFQGVGVLSLHQERNVIKFV
jgi:hypothetical protein